MTWVVVGFFGAFGALARYGVSGVVQRMWRTTFPVGTLVVNVSGTFAAGVLMGLATGRSLPDVLVVAAAVGFLGGYSTFSTWMVESVLAAETGGRVGIRRATENLVVPLVAGVIVAGIGYALGQWM